MVLENGQTLREYMRGMNDGRSSIGESNGTESLPGMLGASKETGIMSYPIEHRKKLYAQCYGMAKVFSEQPDRRMVLTAAESKNVNLKIAAALYWGIVKETDEWLFKSIEDPNPFVAHAAYESCCQIAKGLHNENYPFESTHDCDAEMKDSVRHMTQLYFANLKTKKPKEPQKLAKKSVQEILGIKE
jgi:hypothetical protein